MSTITNFVEGALKSVKYLYFCDSEKKFTKTKKYHKSEIASAQTGDAAWLLGLYT